MKVRRQQRLAVLIPCYNEEKTIGNVVRQFRLKLPEAQIYVFDNQSTDRTVNEASMAGAVIKRELRRGKGYVIQSMFREVEADIYVMVDGDGTYPANQVEKLIEPILQGEADMVVGSRLHACSESAFKRPNKFGNWVFRAILNCLFHVQVTDLLSGFRAFSREVVKGLPVFSRGFEGETELTIKCLERGFRVVEIPVNLTVRPEGSESKIRVVHDGLLILSTLLALARDYRPLAVFGFGGLLLLAGGVVPGLVVLEEFALTGRILRIPSAILSVGLVLAGMLVLLVGIVLHAISRRFQELDRQMLELLTRDQDILHSDNRAECEVTNAVYPRYD